jgi:hypothetical protein
MRLSCEEKNLRRKTVLLNLARSWETLAGQYERLEASKGIRPQATKDNAP